ncbi:MAG TPA: hypothetical protein VGY53_00385 [Isosphaeraceae bacterium]|nr:hypothetical protein [Isosphaeraceae bacterium]
MVKRRTLDPLDLHVIRAFVGRLDEFAIYDHSLSALEVLRHFQLASSQDQPR